jgi:hypothetical protein
MIHSRWENVMLHSSSWEAKVLDLYSEDLQFESQPGQRLFWLRVFVFFLCSSRQIPGLDHDQFPPDHHSSLIHYHSTLYGVVKWPTKILTLCCFLLHGSIYVRTISERSRRLMDCTAAMRFSTGFCEKVSCLSALVRMLHVRPMYQERGVNAESTAVVETLWLSESADENAWIWERGSNGTKGIGCMRRNYMVWTLHQITYVTVIRSRRTRWTTHEARS